jgi:hypothetical protein
MYVKDLPKWAKQRYYLVEEFAEDAAHAPITRTGTQKSRDAAWVSCMQCVCKCLLINACCHCHQRKKFHAEYLKHLFSCFGKPRGSQKAVEALNKKFKKKEVIKQQAFSRKLNKLSKILQTKATKLHQSSYAFGSLDLTADEMEVVFPSKKGEVPARAPGNIPHALLCVHTAFVDSRRPKKLHVSHGDGNRCKLSHNKGRRRIQYRRQNVFRSHHSFFFSWRKPSLNKYVNCIKIETTD